MVASREKKIKRKKTRASTGQEEQYFSVNMATTNPVKDWKLYQFYESPFCNKIRRVLAYKGLLSRVEIVEVVMSSSLKSIHLQGKLPVLEFEDGTKVCDSTDVRSTISSSLLSSSHPPPFLDRSCHRRKGSRAYSLSHRSARPISMSHH
jgi:hypothetical protein